jgi:hypothetical protein
VVAVLDDDGVDAVVFSLEDRPPVEGEFARELGSDERLLVYVLDYVQSLERLGLTEGRLAAAGPGERSCALVEPGAVRRNDATEGRDTEWLAIVVADVRARVIEHLVHGHATCRSPDLCLRPVGETITLADNQNIGIILRRDARFALVAGTGGTFYDVDESGYTIKPEMSGLPSHAGAFAPDRTLWLGGSAGRVAFGQDFANMTVEVVGDPSETIHAIHVRDDGDVYAVAMVETATQSRLLRFDGAAWSEVGRRDLRGLRPKSSNAGFAVSLDGALVAGDGSEEVWIVDVEGRARNLQPDDTRTSALATHPRLGVLRGNELGAVHYSTNLPANVWLGLPTTLGRPVEMIDTFARFTVYGGTNGALVQHHEGSAPCEVEGVPGVDLDLMAAFSDRALMGGGNVDHGHENRVVWVRFDAP